MVRTTQTSQVTRLLRLSARLSKRDCNNNLSNAAFAQHPFRSDSSFPIAQWKTFQGLQIRTWSVFHVTAKKEILELQANAYEFQSTSVIDVLKKLLLEFKDKKGEGEKEVSKLKLSLPERARDDVSGRDLVTHLCGSSIAQEMNSVNAFNMVIQDLTHATDEAKQAVEDKTAALNEKKAQAGQLQKQIAATTDVKTEIASNA
eukprot:160337-Amphidinium_carterae.1